MKVFGWLDCELYNVNQSVVSLLFVVKIFSNISGSMFLDGIQIRNFLMLGLQ
jgi:hypothetical protein